MTPAVPSPGPAAPGPEGAEWTLGAHAGPVAARLAAWEADHAAGRVWSKDPTFWPAADPRSVSSRLGWLDLPASANADLPHYDALAGEVREERTSAVVLLGMGGSSLAAEVYGSAFRATPGAPALHVLDSTHPGRIRAVRAGLDLAHTLFLVSSKSGTTLEPNALCSYFWEECASANVPPGPRFVAITDPGTPLEKLARSRGFRDVFTAPPDVGGRYSALTPFGLVPAALRGVDLRRLLERAARMARACGAEVPAHRHPGLRLGAFLGELGRAGCDKVVLLARGALLEFPLWAEQLLAESTGKHGTGLVPVAGEVRPFEPARGPEDRVFVSLGLRGGTDPGTERGLADVAARGTPTLRRVLDDPYDLGAEFFCWEFGVAAAGAVLGIDPFDQPDVELAKELARREMAHASGGGGPAEAPIPPETPSRFASRFATWATSVRPGDYLGLQAYLDPTVEVQRAVHELRGVLRARLGVPTTLGFGPRFLHSTGQLHKGGPPTGRFVQLVDQPKADVPVPGASYTFGEVIRAQAAGDAEALRSRGRSVVAVELGAEPVPAMHTLTEALRE